MSFLFAFCSSEDQHQLLPNLSPIEQIERVIRRELSTLLGKSVDETRKIIPSQFGHLAQQLNFISHLDYPFLQTLVDRTFPKIVKLNTTIQGSTTPAGAAANPCPTILI
jgi:oligoribonuclease (3'-5' exoribonuclease)